MTATDEDIAKLEEALAKATPGPWTVERRDATDLDGQRYETEGPALVMALDDCEHHPVADCSANHSCGRACEDNADAITKAVNLAPALIARLRAAEAERKAFKIAASNLRQLWGAIIPPGPRCRDCADFDGRCQGDGKPCDPQQHALELIEDLKARAGKAEAERDAWGEAITKVMQQNPGFNWRDWPDGIAPDEAATFFEDDLAEAWRQVKSANARAEAAEAEAAYYKGCNQANERRASRAAFRATVAAASGIIGYGVNAVLLDDVEPVAPSRIQKEASDEG